MKVTYSFLLISSISLATISLSLANEDKHTEHSGETAEQHAAHAQDKAHHANETAEEHAAHAHNEHKDGEHYEGDAHHGGLVSHVDGTHYEFVAEEDKLIFYAEGLPEGDALKTIQVHLTILQGKEKQSVELQLAEEDGHRFEADGAFKLAKGDKVVATIHQEGKTPKLVRFEF